MNTIELIKKASQQIIKQRPSYGDILGFYAQVFSAQVRSRQSLNIDPVTIKEDLLAIKLENNMPLSSPEHFLIDQASAEKLFREICDLAIELAPGLASNAGHIKTAVEAKGLDLEVLFKALLEKQEQAIEELIPENFIPKELLVLFGYLAISPSVEAGAEQLETYIEKDDSHKKGYCPICGSHPDLAFFDINGKRYLKCCFCNHQWLYARMGCAFCETTDPDALQYFFSQEEKEYRVDLCDKCRNYIKVVDMRHMERGFFPNLEMISTLHLDMKADEIGYINKSVIGLG